MALLFCQNHGWERLQEGSPQEEEAGRVGDGLNLQLHDLLPRPGGDVDARRAPRVLLPRRIDEHHVKLGAEGLHVQLELPQVRLRGTDPAATRSAHALPAGRLAAMKQMKATKGMLQDAQACPDLSP